MASERRYIPAAKVRHRYGDCCDMTLWRWLKADKLGFPKPIYINGRRYWDECELDEFDQQQAVKREPRVDGLLLRGCFRPENSVLTPVRQRESDP